MMKWSKIRHHVRYPVRVWHHIVVQHMLRRQQMVQMRVGIRVVRAQR